MMELTENVALVSLKQWQAIHDEVQKTIVSNLKQINLVKKQDNLLSKLLILRSRVSQDNSLLVIDELQAAKPDPNQHPQA